MSGPIVIDYERRERRRNAAMTALYAPEVMEVEFAMDAIREMLDYTGPRGEPHMGEAIKLGDLVNAAATIVLASRLRRATGTSE